MNCNQVQTFFADKIRSVNKTWGTCIGITSSCLLVTIVISLIGLSVTGPHKSNQLQKAVNVTKIFEKFGIPRNLWKTLISGKDDSSKIEEESNEIFSINPYLMSKSYVRKHGGKMRTDEDLVADDFSQFSTWMERKIYRTLVKTFGIKHYDKNGCSICILNLAQAIIKENKPVEGSTVVTDRHNFEVRTLKKYMKIMQEAYVKRVIEIFHLRPEDLDMTPEYFCEIGFCHWKLLKKLTSPETTS